MYHFFTQVKKYFTTLVNRRNTITGVLYKDDPTIMRWACFEGMAAWPGWLPSTSGRAWPPLPKNGCHALSAPWLLCAAGTC